MSNKKEVLTIKKDSLKGRDSLIGFLVIVFLGSFIAFSNLQSEIDNLENRLVKSDLNFKILAKSIREDKVDLNKDQPSLAVNDAQFLLDKIISLETELADLETSVNDLKKPKMKSGLYDPSKDDISYLFSELSKLKTSVKDLKSQKKKNENSSVVNNVSNSDKYKYKSNWRSISMNMSRSSVRKILGEPDSINIDVYEEWIYPEGQVSFSKYVDQVRYWKEPKWN